MTRNTLLSKTLISRFATLLALTLLSVSCSTVTSRPRVEPEVIIIRNSTTSHIKSVKLRASANALSRFGTISPLPVGVDQSIIRPSPVPFKLPDSIEITWVDRNNKSVVRNVYIGYVLYREADKHENAIVFDIKSNTEVIVYCEEFKSNL